MLKNAKVAAHWFQETWKDRNRYRALSDAFSIATLRISVTGRGRRLPGHKSVAVRLKSLNDPVWLGNGSYDFYAFLEIFRWGEYEPAEAWHLSAGELIVDSGSNVGLAARYPASLWPNCQFLSIEPDAYNFEAPNRHCSGIAQNGKLNAIGAFVSQQDGNAGIDRSRGSLGFRMSEANNPTESETIQCISLPTLLEKYAPGGREIGLFKCDIEGAEAELFRDCQSWIGRVEHLIVETHSPYSAKHLKNDLQKNGWVWDSSIVHEKQNQALSTSTCFFKRSSAKV